MQYRVVPQNGDRLSALGFGCMRLPMSQGQIDQPRAIAQIRYAIDHGVNYIDTAWPYHAGQSEPLVGLALQVGYRERVKLATKLPAWMVTSRGDMDLFLNAQLEKLQTDRIDYYLLHSLNGATWDNMLRLGALEFLDQAQADGRIVNAGFSFHGLAEDFTRIVDAYPWTFCQIQYNFLDEQLQAGTAGLEYAAQKGLAVIVMEPLRGGNLARNPQPPEIEELWAQDPPQHRTSAARSLRWIWNHPQVTVVLSGMNDEEHIDENLALADQAQAGVMSPQELELTAQVARKYRELMVVGCTGCGYCMPCPSDVAIPLCFETYNQLHMFGGLDEMKFIYAVRASGVVADGKPGFASQCVECGACVDQCPQQIEIPQMLARVASELEDGQLMDRVAKARQIFAKGVH